MNPAPMTYLAQTKADRIQLPPAIAEFIANAGWVEICVAPGLDGESLTAYPLPHPDAPRESGHVTRLDESAGLRIGEEIRKRVKLDGQSVMVRVEGEVVRIYLRQVFKALGFRPK